MLFRVLGPLRLWDGAGWSPVAAAQQRVVLAVLLAERRRLVTVDRLVDEIWGAHPPVSAVKTVQVYAMRLRRQLGVGFGGRLATQHRGYTLLVDEAELDIGVFEHLVDSSRQLPAGDQPETAAARLTEALALWRGPALADVPASRTVSAQVARLTQARLDATDERLDALLTLGRHVEVVGEARRMVEEHPLRERAWAQLMMALYRLGRRGAALDTYQQARRVLVAELGLEPGTQLRELQQMILADESDAPDVTPATPTPSSVTPTGTLRGEFDAPVAAMNTGSQPAVGVPRPTEPVVPHQLPADVPGFTGRAAELGRLDEGGPVVLLCGTAGVGKTALAVHWAHRVRADFPDGQMYVNLRGYDVDRPVSVGEALTRFLDALGVTGKDVPLDVDERAARYRTEVADRRILIVLDNAASVDQVRLLLPGSASCRVVVTSRDSLAGLVVLHGARRVNVDPLPRDDAAALLRALIGARADADPATVATLAEQCARLPLALRLAVELAVAHPSSSLAELVAELADRHRRLRLLDAGDDVRTAIRVVFSWSYQQLPPDAGRAFRTLGLHPGPDLDAYAVAALVGTDLDHARHLLDRLVRAHLVQPDHTGRYALHDLLRAYAAERAVADDMQFDRSASVRRMLDYYTWVTAAATRTLFPVESVPLPAAQRPGTPTPSVAVPEAAWAWLDAERVALLAACVYAANHGWPQHAVALSRALHRYLDSGHFTDALAIHSQALAAARRAGDEAGQAHTLLNLGAILRSLGKYDLATQHQVQALELHRRSGDRPGEARTLSNLGIVAHRLNDLERATQHLHAALALYRDLDDRYGEASVLTNLGGVQTRPDHYPEAVRHLSRAAELFHSIGGAVGEASALSNLGDAYRQLGRYTDAAKYIRAATVLFRDSSHRFGQAGALTNLGLVYSRLDQHEQAIDCLSDALTLFREIGHPHGEAHTLNGLAEALLAAGQPAEAGTHHSAAFTIAIETGDRAEQTRAEAGLVRAHDATTHTRPETRLSDGTAAAFGCEDDLGEVADGITFTN